MESTHVMRIRCGHERTWSFARFEVDTRRWVPRHMSRAYINFAMVSAALSKAVGKNGELCPPRPSIP